MTLVMTAGIGSAFCVMTSDYRLAYNMAGEFMPIENEVCNKAHQLTDYTLFGWGGMLEGAEHIREQLETRLNRYNDLAECKDTLSAVIGEGHKEKTAILKAGFYKDTTSGMLLYNGEGEVKELKLLEGEYRYSILPPKGEYSDQQNELFYIPEFFETEAYNSCFGDIKDYDTWLNKSFNLVIKQLISIHKLIAIKEPCQATTEGCYMAILKGSNGKLLSTKGSF